jgi:hypothetical protein
MAINALELMMQFATPLLQLHEMLVSMWDENNYMHFLQPHSTPLVDKSTLCLLKMAFAPSLTLSLPTPHSTPLVDESTLCLPKMAFALSLTLSLPTQHKRIYFLDLVQLKDLLLPMQVKPRKGAIATNTPLINSSP